MIDMEIVRDHIIQMIYFIVVSLIAVIITVYDKAESESRGKKKKRIPESWLFGIAAIGGSAAMYITMLIIRHKTRQVRFMYGIPAIFLIQAAIIIGLHILIFAKN